MGNTICGNLSLRTIVIKSPVMNFYLAGKPMRIKGLKFSFFLKTCVATIETVKYQLLHNSHKRRINAHIQGRVGIKYRPFFDPIAQ